MRHSREIVNIFFCFSLWTHSLWKFSVSRNILLKYKKLIQHVCDEITCMQEYRLDLPCGKVRVKETIPKVIVEIEVMIYNVELIMVADLIYC